jgi:hypothetical protein
MSADRRRLKDHWLAPRRYIRCKQHGTTTKGGVEKKKSKKKKKKQQ